MASWFLAPRANALTNNLALTPPMGWNSWYVFYGNIDEVKIRAMADAMATNGMKEAGYQYICIDDGWQTARDTNGVLVADPNAFPSGIKALADYIHARGLKFGIYTDHGTTTCMGRPASYGYEYLDANTYAAWGVDFVKEDNCNLPPGDNPQADYALMSAALRECGQPVVFNICAWAFKSYDPDLSHMWRTTDDTVDTWSGITSKFALNSAPAYLAGPGRWNDPDILQVGLGGMSFTEDQAHFSLYCLWAAPLVAGNNLATMSAKTRSILLNPEVIAVDQDPQGEQGVRVASTAVSGGTLEVWSKPLGSDFNSRAVILLNNSTNASAAITVTWTNLGLQPGAASVRDLWARSDLGIFTNSFTTNVPSHGVVMVKVLGLAPPLPIPGTNYLSDLQEAYAYTGWGTLAKDKSVLGNPLKLNGTSYSKGLGAHAFSGVEYRLGGMASRFQTDLGVDDEVGASGSVVFQVFADGTRIYDSGPMTGGAPHKSIDLDVRAVNRLTLGVADADDGNGSDHADWAGARIVVTNLSPAAPAVPTELTASPGDSVGLSWDAGHSALSWNVRRATNSSGPFDLLGASTIPNYTDANVLVGATYYYVVSAVGKFGESSNCPPVGISPCSPPGVPTGVNCSLSNGVAELRWNSAPGATSYTVYRSLAATPYSPIAWGVTNTSYTDLDANPDAICCYVVRAANACSQSAPSEFVAVRFPPAAPVILTATAANNLVSLGWTAPIGAVSYNVKRATAAIGPYTTVFTGITGTLFVDVVPVTGVAYYYVVSALSGVGESANSAPVSVVPTSANVAYWTNALTATAQAWAASANWTNAVGFPNHVGAAAVIHSDIASPQTITLSQPITVGSVSLGDPNGSAPFILAGNGGSLVLDNAGASAVLVELPGSCGDTIAAPVLVSNTLTIANFSTNALTLAGTISGSPTNLILEAGTLQVGDGGTNGALGSAPLVDGGALVFKRSDTLTLSNGISGPGALFQNGTGKLVLNCANSFSGGTTVNAGVLQVSGPNSPSSTLSGGNITINNGGTLLVGADNSLVGYSTTGSKSITLNAGGVLTNAGSSTCHLNVLVMNGGVLGANMPNSRWGNWYLDQTVSTLGNGCASLIVGGNAALSQAGGTIFDIGSGDTLTVATSLAETSSGADNGLVKRGPGTLLLAGANTYTGPTTVHAGVLEIDSPGAYSGPLLVAGGVLRLNAPGAVAPQLITAGLVDRFDADALTGLTNGATVSTWKDTSGAGNNAVLSAGTPTYQAGVLNGRAVVRFPTDGNSFFSLATRRTDVRTVFWVARESTPGLHFLLGDTAAGGTYHFHREPSSYHLWSPTYASANILSGTTRANGMEVDGTSYSLGSGWNLLDVVTTGSVTAGTLCADRGTTFGGRSWAGDMAEILIYNTALTPVQVRQVEAYLSSKWLPGSTPPVALSGPVSVGSNARFGGNGTAGAVSVADGGGIEGGYNGAGTLALSNLTFGGTGTLTVAVNSNTVPVVVSNLLTLGGSPVMVQVTNPPGPGTYHLLQFQTLTGPGGFVVPGSPANCLATNGHFLDLVVIGPLGLVTGVRQPDNTYQLSFIAPAGQPFRVLATNRLNAPVPAWPLLTNGVVGPNGTVTFSDPAPMTNTRRFYLITSP